MKREYISRSLPPPQSNVDMHSTQTAVVSTTIVPHNINIDKCPRFYAIFVHMTNISSSHKKPMSVKDSQGLGGTLLVGL